MHSLLTAVRKTILKFDMVSAGDKILVGVSGGADSVCLALVLKELGYETAIAHVNHGLRGAESDADESFTRRLAVELSVPFFSKKVSINTDRGNIEAEGRAARKSFFAEVAAEHAFTKIAVAHTKDDRVETFLLNLFRGAGSEGLVTMPAVTETTVRPLIETNRLEIESYLQERHREWRTDETNFDRRFARNRLRHDVIPDLASLFNPRLVETLSRTVEILEGEDAWMRAISGQWLRENGMTSDREVVLNAKLLAQEPVGLARRVLRDAVRSAGSSLTDVTFDHVEAARSLLRVGKSGKKTEIPGGLTVSREFDKLVIRGPHQPVGDYEYRLQIPGSVHIPELRTVFTAEIVEIEGNPDRSGRVYVDGDAIGPYVRIRNWKPGDYYEPVGLPAGKLKKLFQRARIPRSQRKGWPVLEAGESIIWVASFPVSREYAACGRSQKVVAFEALPS